MIAPLAALLVMLTSPAPTPADTLRLSLRDAVALARSGAPTVAGAEARLDEARARTREARSALLPQLGATAAEIDRSFSRASLGLNFPGVPDRIGPFSVQDARVTGRVALLDLASRSRLRAARTAVGASEADVQATSDNAALAAAQAYLTLERAEALVRARQADITIADRLRALVEVQHRAGTVAGLEQTRAEVQVTAAKSGLVSARGAVDRARFDLLRTLGADISQPVATADTLSLPMLADAAAADSLVHLATMNRPELVAIDRQLAAVRQFRQSVRQELLPTIGLAADYGYNGKYFNDAVLTHTLAVQLTWTGFDGGRTGARTAEQDAQLAGIAARNREVRDAVEAETRTSLAGFATARDLVATARERDRLAELELSQAEDRFRTGLAGSLDVISAQSSVNRAQTDLIDALYGYNTARLSVLRAVGRLSSL